MKNLLLLPVIFFFLQSSACTTFLLRKDGNLLFGRNYDWVSGTGIVHTNQRGLFKTSSLEKTAALHWVSLFGSITFNQYGKEFPTGGMNEQGLVVELMWLDGSKYPEADKRPAIGVLQWIQYQLDIHSTVDELIGSDKNIRISDGATPLHFLVADAKGNAATIEFLQGEMVVHKGEQLPFPVLTNDTYATSVRSARDAMAEGLAAGSNSLDRFVKTCKLLKQVEPGQIKLPLEDFAFSILDQVAQGDFTKWSIVYDISRKKISFKTANFRSVKTISFPAFNFDCTSSAKMFDMNQPAQGDISNVFILPDKKAKEIALEKAILESNAYVTINDDEKKLLLEFEQGIYCDKERK